MCKSVLNKNLVMWFSNLGYNLNVCFTDYVEAHFSLACCCGIFFRDPMLFQMSTWHIKETPLVI